jgi:hypothetical protein
MTSKMVVFVNLLSLVAPSIWVVASGVLGFSIGRFGPNILQKLKNDRSASSKHSSGSKVLHGKHSSRRTRSFRKASPNPPARRNGRKRPSS